ncbi:MULTISPECIES: MFS transporter [unclassified Janthinobacterium]|uniref:MFS transporter n=1 Tax=unclassified Janthinobacterium TaxID=2610881 RepID=UPI00160E5B7A|nr:MULTISPECIES: MFS transporter [unclassified Janthinobacterium]MBB5606844.1 YNFM family putative membrane transporter [Janthinobacterium sp. S3T4]MBB5612106.1 YNFM family putative membrane transporter [Janthinobacterium sp. S3M3]
MSDLSLPLATPAIAKGTPEFTRTNRALFFGGFSTFSLLYCIQPLFPLLSHQFHLSPAQSSWSLSVSSGLLAISLVLLSAVSDRIGRKSLMVFSMLSAAVLTVLSAFAQDFTQLLAIRAVLGIALGGMPAVAMAYLGEEIDPPSLGLSMGLYIAGSAFGGMSGRLIASVLSDFLSWRWALGTLGVAGLLAGLEFWRSLPTSKNFVPTTKGWNALPHAVRQHFSDQGLPWLFILAFLLMGCFVSLYNYIGYRLLAAPFGLRQSTIGLLAFLYLIGIFSSVWAGRLVDRLGRRGVLWIMLSVMLSGILLTLFNSLVLIVAGMALATFGFFASHSIASSWVSRRARAPQALASAFYLLFYYLGSSLIGSASGMMWGFDGWTGVIIMLGLCLGGGVLIALRLRHLQPLGASVAAAA